jgi:glycosyltransferase involved in cell wall biosynthesis
MKRAISVLHIIPAVRGYGAERIIVELLKRLPSARVDAALLTIYEPPAEAISTLPFPIFYAGRKNRRDRLFLGRLVREIRRYRPDIVHTHTHVGKYWGRVAAMMAGVKKVVHTEHNPCDFRPHTWLERRLDAILHRWTSRVVTFFPDQGTALMECERLPRHKLVFIPNGLEHSGETIDRNEARDRLNVGPHEYAIMTVGRMEYQKNHILALRAFAALPEGTRSRTLLLFAGSGENEESLRELASVLRIADRVRFLGYRTDVPSLLPGIDLLLMTSWFEGMPLALLEAMIAGVPIVTTPWRGARDMLGDGEFGFLASGFEAPQVAAEIQRALNQPTLCREIALRAHRYVRDYDLSRMADAHRHMYMQLCGEAS